MIVLKSTSKSESTNSRSWHVPVLVGAIVIVAAMVAWTSLYKPFAARDFGNRAEEIAKPLEEGLAKAGGVKKLGGGDPGHGPDNIEPYYDAIYEMPMEKEQAVALANTVAAENGYKLTHASPSNRGHLGAVADIYIDAWYFDNSSKQSNFSDLNSGPIRLAFKVGDEDRPDSPGKTTLRVNVRMPNARN
jgi:hypothetical protein